MKHSNATNQVGNKEPNNDNPYEPPYNHKDISSAAEELHERNSTTNENVLDGNFGEYPPHYDGGPNDDTSKLNSPHRHPQGSNDQNIGINANSENISNAAAEGRNRSDSLNSTGTPTGAAINQMNNSMYTPNMPYMQNNKMMMNGGKNMHGKFPMNMNPPMSAFQNSHDIMTNPLRMPMFPGQPNPMLFNNPMHYMNSKAYLKHLKYNKVITADPSIPPNETLYVKNLNDRIKIDEMKKSLKDLFKQYGVIEDLVVMKSFWRKGQAWVVYDTVESSTKALNALQGFVLFGKIMQINYSHNKSDVHSKRDGTFVERSKEPKKPKQILERERKQKEIFEMMQRNFIEMQMNNFRIMQNNELEKRKKIDLSQMDTQDLIAKAQAKAYEEKNKKKNEDFTKNNNTMYQQPSPYYPMNAFAPMQNNIVVACKILFVENVVENVNTEEFNDLFKKFSGFIEARIIPQRNVAFVDYSDEAAATNAMKALQNYELQGSKLKISYAKR
ncbi:U1 small nuclear ribonucleoprotein A, putative [Plasmodium knowlesi strain H]|uniref:U1 small nuclear ribonucleoprotein A, putative n=3 Tax=Plasmodium knowlesi TaxID=5850 RepID=A0A1A7W452_PLAKH|nr:U1 small nuclear ribonucleoprotein A, putative [Plasmodium knowlesi strain H]OTN63933.1 putative U1 small nuclear ribonucleoprotein A [Plasmodium knowlesi]CAA9990671.1 U1 small nuclear ribonucleoprotein A, putative [Plasmodium knowlesi strain H]SBO25949.1 U1 small nuclear ribonucleoprotein A, putative [Plasmodium knowlesi strain H]SBO28687.1 U1 small nuclear ribonucleoprotein A, putative [Plasmodium knowlesi strain H]VVS80145.1 U1 small nuclear ribonucleoprotein A, putative [Plasmodium know